MGLHPFGRFEGKSAMEMAVDAIRLALDDAGVDWKDIQLAVGGSWTVANPDAIVGMVGLTGMPFTDVFNACATAASAARLCADGIGFGDYDIGIAVGMDKHPRGAFTEDPSLVGMPALVRRERAVPHHEFLRHEDQPLHARPRHLRQTLAKVAAKNFRNGALNPNALRRNPMSVEEILSLAGAELPADPVHVLRARRRRRGRRACAAPTTRTGTPPSRCTCAAVDDPHPPLRRVRGEQHFGAGRGGRLARRSTPRRAAYREGRDRTGRRGRHPAAGHRRGRGSNPHGRERILRRRRAGEDAGRRATEIAGAMPVNTDGG